MKNTIIALAVLFFGLSSVRAQNADTKIEPNLEALTNTQNLLRDPKQRQEALTTPNARSAASQVSTVSLGRPEIENQLYDVSADLMTWVVQMSQTDPEFFTKLSQNSNDPAFIKKFYEKVPAAQRDKIKSIAAQIESVRNPPPAKSP